MAEMAHIPTFEQYSTVQYSTVQYNTVQYPLITASTTTRLIPSQKSPATAGLLIIPKLLPTPSPSWAYTLKWDNSGALVTSWSIK